METQDGKTEPLLPIIKGIKTILTVGENGYKLVNARKEILRQGKDTNVFNVIDSMLFDPLPMYVKDEIKCVEMDYGQYERVFGFGRVERDETRRFLAYVERTSSGIGIGLIGYEWSSTLAVHSLYNDKPMSHREVANYIASFIEPMLKASERAKITGVGLDANQLSGAYAGIVRMYESDYKDRFEQVRLLAMDATRRKTNIIETIEEPVRYLASGLFIIHFLEEKTTYTMC